MNIDIYIMNYYVCEYVLIDCMNKVGRYVNQGLLGYGFCGFLHVSASADSFDFQGWWFVSLILARATKEPTLHVLNDCGGKW